MRCTHLTKYIQPLTGAAACPFRCDAAVPLKPPPKPCGGRPANCSEKHELNRSRRPCTCRLLCRRCGRRNTGGCHTHETAPREDRPFLPKHTLRQTCRHNSSCPDDACDPFFPSGSSPRKCLSRTVKTSAHTATPVNLSTSSMSACRHEGSSFSTPPPPANGSVGGCNPPLASVPFRRRKLSSRLAVPVAGWLLVLDEEP